MAELEELSKNVKELYDAFMGTLENPKGVYYLLEQNDERLKVIEKRHSNMVKMLWALIGSVAFLIIKMTIE